MYNWSLQEIVCISLGKVAGALLNPNGIQLYSGGPIGMGTLSCDGHLGVPVLGCMLTSGQWLRNTDPAQEIARQLGMRINVPGLVVVQA